MYMSHKTCSVQSGKRQYGSTSEVGVCRDLKLDWFTECRMNINLCASLSRDTLRNRNGWNGSQEPPLLRYYTGVTLAAAKPEDQTVDLRVQVQIAPCLPWFPKSCGLTDCSHRQKRRHLHTSMPVRLRLSYA